MAWKKGEIREGIFPNIDDKTKFCLLLMNEQNNDWRCMVLRETTLPGGVVFEVGEGVYVVEKNSPNTKVLSLVALVGTAHVSGPGMGWPFRDDWDNLPDA